jgi:hypothetical protein
MPTPTCRDWRVGPRHPGRPCHRLHEESHASLWRWPRAPPARPHLASPSAAAIRAVVCSRLHVVCRRLSGAMLCACVFHVGPCRHQLALLLCAARAVVCSVLHGVRRLFRPVRCMLHVARCVLLFLAGPPRDLVRAAAVLHEPRAALPRRRNPGTAPFARRAAHRMEPNNQK